MEGPQPRRRWLSYSLRTFFVLLTVLGVWLGLVVERVQRQKRSAVAIEASGGLLGYEADHTVVSHAEPSESRPKDQLSPPTLIQRVKIWGLKNLGRDYVFPLVSVAVDPSKLEGDLLSHLHNLPDLQTINLAGVEENDPSVQLVRKTFYSVQVGVVKEVRPRR